MLLKTCMGIYAQSLYKISIFTFAIPPFTLVVWPGILEAGQAPKEPRSELRENWDYEALLSGRSRKACRCSLLGVWLYFLSRPTRIFC
jgi:hypothetical protein